MSIVARGLGRVDHSILVTFGLGRNVVQTVDDDTLAGSRARFYGDPDSDFDRVSRRVKRAVDKALAVTTTPLTDVEQFVIQQSLRAFIAAGEQRTSGAINNFIADTIASLQRSDLERRAASQQFAEDQLEAVAQQRRDNRRRAIILVILLMLL